MKRFLPRSILCLAPAALTVLFLGLPASALDIGLQGVNLSCSDGTNLDLGLDVATVTRLSDAVSSINLYPAGDPALACGLQPLATDPSGNPHYDYAVGGGQAVIVTRCAPEEDNFGFSAHAFPDSDTLGVGGHLSLTIPQCTSSRTGMTYGPSHLGGKVDCIDVLETGTDADLTIEVEQATGLFASSAEFPPSGLLGSEVAFHVHDGGIPGGAGDLIGWDFGTASFPCDDDATPFVVPVDRGNINVHDA